VGGVNALEGGGGVNTVKTLKSEKDGGSMTAPGPIVVLPLSALSQADYHRTSNYLFEFLLNQTCGMCFPFSRWSAPGYGGISSNTSFRRANIDSSCTSGTFVHITAKQ